MGKGMRAKNWDTPAKTRVTSKAAGGRKPGKGRLRRRNVKVI